MTEEQDMEYEIVGKIVFPPGKTGGKSSAERRMDSYGGSSDYEIFQVKPRLRGGGKRKRLPPNREDYEDYLKKHGFEEGSPIYLELFRKRWKGNVETDDDWEKRPTNASFETTGEVLSFKTPEKETDYLHRFGGIVEREAVITVAPTLDSKISSSLKDGHKVRRPKVGKYDRTNVLQINNANIKKIEITYAGGGMKVYDPTYLLEQGVHVSSDHEQGEKKWKHYGLKDVDEYLERRTKEGEEKWIKRKKEEDEVRDEVRARAKESYEKFVGVKLF